MSLICAFTYTTPLTVLKTPTKLFSGKKTKFIRQELQHLKSEDRALFQEENWDEEIPNCPKQKKQEDCGVFSCLFAEHLILSNNLDEIELDDTDPRGEMTNDLLALATPENKVAYLPLPKNLQSFISNDLHTSIPTEDQKVALDQEVASAGLTYRQPPTPKDGNCLFHAMSDQLTRVGRLPQTPSKFRSDLVRYLKSNSTTPDGVHFREFTNHGGWDIYLRRMSRDGEWGDWIALWGLVNMLNLPVALVSSLGKEDYKLSIQPQMETKEGTLQLWPCLDMKQKFFTIAWKPFRTLLRR